jgi:hypothetical protein
MITSTKHMHMLENAQLIWIAKKATTKQASYTVRSEARRLLEERGYRFVGSRVERANNAD